VQLEDIIAKELASIINEQFSKYITRIDDLEAEVKLLAGRKYPEKGERGEKGDCGDVGLRGETGIPGPQGIVGPIGPAGPSGPIGPQGEIGPPGPEGASGVPGKDGAGPSRGRHRGPWKQDEDYHLDDGVTSGGSGWVAIVEGAKGRPGDSKDWQLFVKKGRDGKEDYA
jgi:hypothetical protein